MQYSLEHCQLISHNANLQTHLQTNYGIYITLAIATVAIPMIAKYQLEQGKRNHQTLAKLESSERDIKYIKR